VNEESKRSFGGTPNVPFNFCAIRKKIKKTIHEFEEDSAEKKDLDFIVLDINIKNDEVEYVLSEIEYEYIPSESVDNEIEYINSSEIEHMYFKNRRHRSSSC